MPSLRENVRSLFPGPKRRAAMDQARQRMLDMADVLETVFERRAYYATGKEGMKIEELDSRALANLLRRNNYISLEGGIGGDNQDEGLRINEFVPISRRMQRYDPLTKRIIATWTDFGFGQNIVITPSDEAVQEWWRTFWTATRNRPILGKRELHKRSDNVLIDGEFFFLYFTDKRTGLVTVRTIVTEEITEFVTLPDDDQTVLYYKREWVSADGMTANTLYYPDWLATDEQLAEAELPKDVKLAQTQDDNVDIDVMQVALTSQTVRGWPLLAASQDWDRAYVDFLQNRAAVSRAVATYVDRVQAKGGSRAVSAFQAQLQSALVDNADSWETNPPPAAGSMAVINEAVNWDRFNMSTGASDAETDGRMLFNMVGIGAGLFPHWLGHGEAFRLATATAMEAPVLRNFQRYQEFWQSIWQDMYDHVLAMGERYGGQSFADKTVEITLDPLLQEDLSGLATALAQLANVPQVALPAKETTRLVLQALRIDDIEDVLLSLFPETEDGQERAAVRVKDLAAMHELLKEARANGNGTEEIVMAGEAFLDALR